MARVRNKWRRRINYTSIVAFIGNEGFWEWEVFLLVARNNGAQKQNFSIIFEVICRKMGPPSFGSTLSINIFSKKKTKKNSFRGKMKKNPKSNFLEVAFFSEPTATKMKQKKMFWCYFGLTSFFPKIKCCCITITLEKSYQAKFDFFGPRAPWLQDV